MQERGWVVIDADQISREVVGLGTSGLDEITRAFGAEILDCSGNLDRSSLASKVFSNPLLRRKLEAIMHPLIEREIQKKVAELPTSTKGVVLEAALWIEIGKGHSFDALWVVDAPEEQRIERVRQRDGLDRPAIISRINSQSTIAEKVLHCDLLIIADGRCLDEQLECAEKDILAKWKSVRQTIRSNTMTCPYTAEQLQTVLNTLLTKGGDYGEVFIEQRRACRLGMDDGRMEDVLATETFGVSIRLMDGETTRFADLIAPSVTELVDVATELASPGNGEAIHCSALEIVNYPSPCPIEKDPAEVPIGEKVSVVRTAEALARDHGKTLREGALRQVSVGYGDSTQCVWNAHVERVGESLRARLTSDYRVQSVLRISVTAAEGDQIETGYQVLGESRGFELFSDEAVERTAKEAVRLAVLALDAKPAPAGTFPVVLSSSAGGTMIHEACGHGLEADLALTGMSAFAGMLGEQVAAQGVTIIDDGTLPSKRGSQSIDDEGLPSQRIVLIENGILKNYLQSRKTAKQMETEPTGNGRRDSYRHIPIPRMRNTFLAPGKENPEDILQSLDKGLLVKHMGGGQVDTVTGNFVFQVTEGYWVENGKIAYQIKNATLSGCGPEVLKQLTRIGNDLEHFDIGTCGKDGQGVPVSDALPTILCPALVVGGTA